MTLTTRLNRIETRHYLPRATVYLPERRAMGAPPVASMTGADAAQLRAAGITGLVIWRGSVAATLKGQRA